MRANTTLDKMTTNKRASLVNLHKTDAFTFKWAFKALSLSLSGFADSLLPKLTLTTQNVAI